MTQSIKHLDCKRIPQLERPLLRWRTYNREIAESWKEHGEVPWWFNERAAVSVLAGAIWRCGQHHYAFEEFKDRKIDKHSPSGKRKGRVDLYFDIDGTKFIAEAKICWPRIDKKIDSETIERPVRAALRDVNADQNCRLPVEERLGIVFAVPSILIKNRKKLDRRLKKWTDSMKTVGEARAWTFPKELRLAKGNNHYYPGIAVFISRPQCPDRQVASK